jgi:DNA processing protein
MPLSPSALDPLLRLAVVPGIGPGRLSTLIRVFGSAERALGASAAQLSSVPGIGPELVKRLLLAAQPEGRERVNRAFDLLERVEAVALTPDDLEYPIDFRRVVDPPYLLFAAGDLSLLRGPGVGIVGTRNPSQYGTATASSIAKALAAEGYVVVSGMAAGIDAAAHAAALAVDGSTVGVLGHGIERIYPSENRDLFRDAVKHGLLLSEFPPGEGPKAGNFPRRNRLIAALSLAVVVVEMAMKSGAQHTVNAALDLGREVFAVPGPIGAASSEGTNQLLKDGARVMTSPQDLLEVLEGVGRPLRRGAGGRADPELSTDRQLPLPIHLPEDHRRLLSLIEAAPRHVDELATITSLATSGILATLLELELEGFVEALPGKRYRRG